MRETKGLFLLFFSITLFFVLVIYNSNIQEIIGVLPHKILMWLTWLAGALGMLDVMQFIKIFKFTPNKKLISDVERRPSKAKQPWK
jgi:hypothetical protein